MRRLFSELVATSIRIRGTYVNICIVLVAAMGLQQRERGNANEADGRAELPLRMARSRARPQNGCASGGRTSKS